jgi:preprotein translocase subunit SecY
VNKYTQRVLGNGNIMNNIFRDCCRNYLERLVTTFELGRTGAVSTFMILAIFVLLVATILFVVFMERALRKILINYPKRQMGNKMYGGESSHLPLKDKPSWCYTCNFCLSFTFIASNFFKLFFFK